MTWSPVHLLCLKRAWSLYTEEVVNSWVDSLQDYLFKQFVANNK